MEKKKVDDSGITIANMNVEGLPWYNSFKSQGDKEPIHLTRGEQKALFKAIFKELIPLVACCSIVFFLVYLGLDIFWLR